MYITHQKCQKKKKDKGNASDAISIKTPQPYLSIKMTGNKCNASRSGQFKR